MKYLIALLMSLSAFAPALASEPAEKPKMMLAKKKADKDKEAKEAKEKKAQEAKQVKK